MTDKNTFFHQKLSLNVRGRLLDLTQPKVMGIVNVTPDSFYDGGRTGTQTEVIHHTGRMLEEGVAPGLGVSDRGRARCLAATCCLPARQA